MSATPDTQVHINNLKYLFDYLWFVWPDEPHPSIYHSDLAPEFSWEPLDLHRASWYLPHHAIRLDWVTFRGKKQKHWTEAPTPQRNHTWHKVHWSNLTVHLGWGLFLFFIFFLITHWKSFPVHSHLTVNLKVNKRQVFFWIDPTFVSRIITGEKSRMCSNKGKMSQKDP